MFIGDAVMWEGPSTDPAAGADPARARRPYRSPRLVVHGHMAAVTRKSGVMTDQQQIRKPSSGVG